MLCGCVGVRVGACSEKCCRKVASSVRKTPLLLNSVLKARSVSLLRSWTTQMVLPAVLAMGTESTQRVRVAASGCACGVISR